MLRKLSGRNAVRQMRDYAVYLITLILSVTLIYAFQVLLFSKEVGKLMVTWSLMPFIVTLASLIIVGILGRLVYFITEFMFKKRSREFGTYMLLGIENKDIAKMFTRENRLVGLTAFGAGLVTGTYFYQILRAVINHMLRQDYQMKVEFSWKGLLLTGLYLFLIFWIADRSMNGKIVKMSIRELLALEKENEQALVAGVKGKKMLLFLSFLSLIAGIGLLAGALIWKPGGWVVVLGMALILLSVLGLFAGTPAVLEHRFENREWKYSGNHLVLYRFFQGKIRTVSSSLGSASALFLLVFLSVSLGVFFNRLMDERVRQVGFDFAVCALRGEDDLTAFEEYAREELPDTETFRYQVYTNGSSAFSSRVPMEMRGEFVGIGYSDAISTDCYIDQSTYETLRKLLGLEAVHLQPDRYYLHCSDFAEQTLRKYAEGKQVQGVSFGGSFTGPMFQQESFGNGKRCILIIPDGRMGNLNLLQDLFAGVSEKEYSPKQYEGIASLKRGDKTYITGRADVREAGSSVVMSIVFPLFYLAVILCASGATILSVQILSGLEQEKEQYQILTRCGMDRKEQLRVLHRYFAVYYVLPVIPAAAGSSLIYFSITGKLKLNVFDGLSFIGLREGLTVLLITGAVFFSIYLIYCMSAYLSYKKSVLS